MKRKLTECFLCLCMLAIPPVAIGSEDVAAMIDTADAARKQAAAAGHEWRYTGKWIKNARAALESGDINKAKKLAEKAQFEAGRALEQAEISKNTWRIAVPR